MWQIKAEVISVVVGALGTIKKGMVENIKKVSERATVTETQKISMLPGICTNPSECTQCINRTNDLRD